MLNPRATLRIGAYLAAASIALIAALVAAALMLSVTVSGESMMPTLHSGDRLEIDVFHRHDIRRFDLVVAHEPGKVSGPAIVKRVIGMPGDQLIVTGGEHPSIAVRPTGSEVTYTVDNPAWTDQVGAARASCCQIDGTSVPAIGTPGAWVTVPVGSYWLIGDNWGESTDSRSFGFVTFGDIQARLSFRLLPWSRQGGVPQPVRLVPRASRNQ